MTKETDNKKPASTDLRLVNKKIMCVRDMTKKEIDDEGWYTGTTVLVLEDGTLLYASRDSEGNDSGCMFGKNPDGTQFGI